VFDTGGLDLKPRRHAADEEGYGRAATRWRSPHGDGGHAPVRLVVLLAVVENAVAGDAMRPGDVLASRKGLTIEVGNTDAEGRLILADALTRAAELAPELTFDFATLTEPRGPRLAGVVPFYTDDDALAGIWSARRRPWAIRSGACRLAGYEPSLDSDIADIKTIRSWPRPAR